jgi:hypothetical protein
LLRSIVARDQLDPYPQGARGKEVEQGQSGADHNVRLLFVPRSGLLLDVDGGVVGAPCASSAARLAAFLCSRLSAFVRCFSFRFSSF